MTKKTMIDANKDLISLQKQVKDIKEDKSKPQTPQNVTNAMFVGNTKDLQKMLKEQQQFVTNKNSAKKYSNEQVAWQ